MISCLAAAHASIFDTSGSLLIKPARKAFFVSFISFYKQIFLPNF